MSTGISCNMGDGNKHAASGVCMSQCLYETGGEGLLHIGFLRSAALCACVRACGGVGVWGGWPRMAKPRWQVEYWYIKTIEKQYWTGFIYLNRYFTHESIYLTTLHPAVVPQLQLQCVSPESLSASLTHGDGCHLKNWKKASGASLPRQWVSIPLQRPDRRHSRTVEPLRT